MNSTLLVFGLLLVITPVMLIINLDEHDIPTRFSIQQMYTMRGFLLSGVTIMVIALLMLMWV